MENQAHTTIRAIAVDDEPLALSVIENFCSKIPSIELIATLSDGIQAIELLKKEEVDVIFTDINMPHLNGIEVIKLLENPPLVIFTTAYQNYALTGFELSAIDYLVKPFSFDRFFSAVNKAEKQLSLMRLEKEHIQETTPTEDSDYLMVKSDYSIVKIIIEEIDYIEGLKDYIKIHTNSKDIVTKSTMKNIEERLPSNFIRLHKSFVVNINKLEKIENNHVVIGKIKIPLGTTYKEQLTHIIDKNRL